MGIRDFFKKDTKDAVVGTKVLVALCNPRFAELAAADSKCYLQFYPATTQRAVESFEDLLRAIGDGYDVVHLFCDVTSAGNIADKEGREGAAARLVERCLLSDVKLLWVASENKPEGYIKGFNAGGKPLNLVLTINRRDSRFTAFLQNLLRKMASGETMPVAWVSLSPQNPKDPRNQDAPACMFAAGRGGVRLR